MAGGRPSKYQDAMLEQAYKLALLGATNEELADFFDISTVTLDSWKNTKPEFLDALKEGKAKADAVVSESLYSRATGYEYTESVPIKVRKGKDEHGGSIEEVVIVDVTKVMPPDTTACIFWLKNRQPSNWRDKTEVKHSGTLTLTSILNEIDGRTDGLPSTKGEAVE